MSTRLASGSRLDRVIRVSGDVYDEIVGRITGYGDIPDTVLRRLFDLPERTRERRPKGSTDYAALALAIRGARGWTQAELASRLDLAMSTISHWETERVDPHPNHASRLIALARREGIEVREREERDDGQDGIR